MNDLINHIQGNKQNAPAVPDRARTMTEAFIALYQRAIQAYQNQNMSPPPNFSRTSTS